MSPVTRQARAATIARALAFAVLLGLQVACLVRMRSPEVVDDAPFFFRYAENIAAGHGYRWNVEEAPVWGASAPLWPLLLALGVRLGLGAQEASLMWGWILTLAATCLLGRVMHRLSGSLGVLALAPLLAVNFLYSFYATAGLESPLSFFLLASALAAIVLEAPGAVLGTLAGLCLVHKIDFAPIGLALVAGAWRWRRPVAVRTSIVAGALAVAWYGFAFWHFGSLLPNSLVSKLHMTDQTAVARAWFFATLLWRGGGWLLLLLVPFGLAALRSHGYLASVTLAAFLPQLAAYTLRPPPEPYDWYAAACAPAVAFLAASGLAWLLRELPRVRLLGPHVRAALAAAALLLTTWLAAGLERPRVHAMNRYLESIEPLRVQAGEWIERNTPADATVYVVEGHVAYHSRRFVYDGSFLNRRREDDLIGKYRPDVAVWTLTLPEHFVPVLKGYRTLKSFSMPGNELPRVCVLAKGPPKPRWGRVLLSEIAPELRRDARSYGRHLLGTGPDPGAVSPALTAEMRRAVAELRARFETPNRGANARGGIPRWFLRLEDALARDAAVSGASAPR